MVASISTTPIIAVPIDVPKVELVDIIPDASDCSSDFTLDNTILAVNGSANPNPIPKSRVPGIILLIWVVKLNW